MKTKINKIILLSLIIIVFVVIGIKTASKGKVTAIQKNSSKIKVLQQNNSTGNKKTGVEQQKLDKDLKENTNDNNISANLYDLASLVPTYTNMTPEQCEWAIRSYEATYKGYQFLNDGSAKCKINYQEYENGHLKKDEDISLGRIEFVTVPFNDSSAKLPVNIKVLITDSNGKSFIDKNVLDKNISFVQAGLDSSKDSSAIKFINEHPIIMNSIFYPVDFIARSWRGPRYHNVKYATSKEDYFESPVGPGYPRRISSEEETKNVFNGEQQFLITPGKHFNTKCWFSTDLYELRMMECPKDGDAGTKTFRYENYLYDRKNDGAFPRNIIATSVQVKNNVKTIQKYTIELVDLKLNGNIQIE
jgi:hypothetical protein